MYVVHIMFYKWHYALRSEIFAAPTNPRYFQLSVFFVLKVPVLTIIVSAGLALVHC